VRVVFTPAAERQLDKLHRYIAKRSSEFVADGYIARIVAFCCKLEQFPLRGTQRDDLLEGLRTIGFERRATIVFIVSKGTVLIEGVYHGGQDFEKHFKK
jgi:toxin ParE1/3/4